MFLELCSLLENLKIQLDTEIIGQITWDVKFMDFPIMLEYFSQRAFGGWTIVD